MNRFFFKLSSINSRIIFGAIIIVSGFMILTGITLSKTFYNSAYSALEDRLTGQIYLLMADRQIIPLQQQLSPDTFSSKQPMLQLPGSVYSQLSGFITHADGTILWQSSAGIENKLPPFKPLNQGKKEHGKKIFQTFYVDGHPFIGLSIAIFWDLKNSQVPLIYHISDDLSHLNNQISDYQYSLWSNLLLMSLILFIALFLILRWGLKPLRDVEQEIKAVEQGEQEQLENSYPDEITPLTHNINQLIQFERQQQLRYRNALSDLAHSLKTPLAIIKGLSFNAEHNMAKKCEQGVIFYTSLNDAVERMNAIIEYQLQRAASNSPSPHIQYLLLGPVVHTLLDSMKKIYRDKAIDFHINIDQDIKYKIDEGDFMEILGNLLDNACKWCQKQIHLSITLNDARLKLFISDDGPGIAYEMLSEITKRGVRADEFTPGHGVGLAIVQDIVSAYNGHIEFSSELNGGLAVNVSFDSQPVQESD